MMFTIGYTKALARQVRERGRYFASCNGCRYYNLDKECTNPNVLGFEITEIDGRTCCVFWQPEEGEDD